MACDLACLHCRAEAIARKDPRRLTTDDGKSLLREVKDSGNSSPIVVLTGGDPFKRDDIFELIEYGSEIGLPMAVSPSTTPLLTGENLQRLRAAGANINPNSNYYAIEHTPADTSGNIYRDTNSNA